MKNWKKVLIWIVSIIVILGAGGIFAANYAVDKLMNSMATSFEDEVDVDGITQSEVTELPVAVSEATPEPKQSILPSSGIEMESAEKISISPAETPTPGKEEPASTTSTNSSVKNDPTSQPIVNSESSSSTGGYTAQVSPDKAKEIQGSVTVKDKANVTSIILGQLSISDIKRLQELANGGLTIDEKREARMIILEKVSEEQYNELSAIAKIYGVSKGKTRDQIIAEEEQLQAQESQEEGSE